MTNELKKAMSHTRRVAAGFVHGLEQMASLGTSGAIERFPRPDRAEAAMRRDWARVGGDMRQATKRVKQLVETKE
jgi:hypothetical protein